MENFNFYKSETILFKLDKEFLLFQIKIKEKKNPDEEIIDKSETLVKVTNLTKFSLAFQVNLNCK